MVDTETYIPTINLREYFEPSTPTSKEELVAKVRKACLEHGFLQIVGHGVPLTSQRQVLAASKKFFELPTESKAELSLYKHSWRRGYEGPGSQKPNEDVLPDQKEVRVVGPSFKSD